MTHRCACIALAGLLASCGVGGPWSVAQTSTKDPINALFGFSSTDVWAAGEDGLILHFDGQQWARVASGTTVDLNTTWGASPSDVWFAGDAATVLRWNGTAIAPVNTAGLPTNTSFDEIRGTSAQNVYFCWQGGLYRYETAFERVSTTCTSIFFSARGDTIQALIPQIGSTSSSDQALFTLNRSMGTPELQIGAVSKFTRALRLTPNELWTLNIESKQVNIRRINGTSTTDEKLQLPERMRVSAMWKNGPTDVWLAGNDGRIARYDGASVKLEVSGETASSAPEIRTVWSNSATTFAAGTGGWLLQRNGQ
jgi:hypothetical protein